MRSVILSFKFLSQFYHKETANFRIILHTLKTLGYEADVKFSSIHEIRSLESNDGEMEKICIYIITKTGIQFSRQNLKHSEDIRISVYRNSQAPNPQFLRFIS